MTILDQICAYKRLEVAAKKDIFPLALLEQSMYFHRTPISLSKSVRNFHSGIIGEHKRRSPSKSVINDKILLPDVIKGYEKAGVSGISVLTDTKYFGGSLDDLLLARQNTDLPLLRKDFMVDSYQIVEAKAFGADAILLIAACLSAIQIQSFSKVAKELGLEVLVEIHNEEELTKVQSATIDMIGVNNRNLKTFEVSLDTSKFLSTIIPDRWVRISESGIDHPDTIKELKKYGFQGFLMGEHFMKNNDPGKAANEFIQQLS
jgi:indole-3-glycerol phosphate synthase